MIASSGGVRTADGGQNFAMATVFDSISKPVIVSEPTAPKHRKSSIYLWFVSFQKTDCWDAKKLNRLHVAILAILVTIYVCHVISSPYIRFIQDDDAIVTIRVIQALCLVGGVAGMVKMFLVNGSVAAMKLMFSGSVRTYIFIFWIVRAVVVEILKGQIMYSFVHFFHGVLIYSTDTWYICNRKVLILNMLLFLSMVSYEFLVSISPFGPSKPSWTFVSVKVTANSLSRSTNFNLFVIFLDALIMVVYDVKRSKFVMLTKKQKRRMVEMDESRKVFLDRLWKCLLVSALAVFTTWVIEIFVFAGIPVELLSILGGLAASITYSSVVVIVYYSTNIVTAKEIWYKLIHERRVLFILIISAVDIYIAFYVRMFNLWTITSLLNVVTFICFDLIAFNFPRRASIVIILILLSTCVIGIIQYTFLKTDCEEKKLPWGLYGQQISYCTISRLSSQTFLSLVFPAALASFMGKTYNLFFCNANILRSTGSVNQNIRSQKYINGLLNERHIVNERKRDRKNQTDSNVDSVKI